MLIPPNKKQNEKKKISDRAGIIQPSTIYHAGYCTICCGCWKPRSVPSTRRTSGLYVHLTGENYDPFRIFTSDLRYGLYATKVRCKNSKRIIVFTSQTYQRGDVRMSLKVDCTERGFQRVAHVARDAWRVTLRETWERERERERERF